MRKRGGGGRERAVGSGSAHMALHPNFSASPYEAPQPAERWVPAAEELRATAYEKLVPPLVARVREGSGRLARKRL